MKAILPAIAVSASLLLVACSSKPLVPFSTDGPPLILAPAADAGVVDRRGRFREIACAVFDARGDSLPHNRDCEEAFTRVGSEAGATGQAVDLGASKFKLTAGLVPGIGWECFEGWLDYENEFSQHMAQFGIESYVIDVAGMSGSTFNAGMIRDAILDNKDSLQDRKLVLVGYSKGAPDTLEAIVLYPEIRPYIAAVVSVAGAVGGSPLAYAADEVDLDLLKHIPGSNCTGGDGKAVESLLPSVRQAWLAEHPLPDGILYYSIVTFPDREHMSSALKSSWKKLARIDPRNDSQVIIYDQLIPGSTLLAYLNADHWAVAVPISEQHPFIGRHFVNHNTYPRQQVFEAVLRMIEEDLASLDR